MGEPLAELQQRLDRLERGNRRWKRVAAFALPASLFTVLIGLALPIRAVEPGRVTVMDSSGRLRAAVGVLPDGSPFLGLYDEHGVSRLNLGLVDGAPHLIFADPSGKSKIALAASDDGSLLLGFRGAGEKLLRAGIAARPDGSSALILYDSGGRARLGLTVEADGTPGLRVMASNGNVIWKAP